jgi:S-adenosylmethionine-diacylglycerol 3-amino-3-carboxypropyl transferase
MSSEPRLHYAQSWEDPETLLDGLRIGPQDTVLSIASSGDNTFALLLRDPRRVVALDRNPAQLHLVELKMAAMRLLDYDAFLSFLGVRPSSDRAAAYALLRGSLSPEAGAYWDRHRDGVERGIIHAGTFERYFRLFRNLVLPLVHSRATIREVFVPRSAADRERFFRERWDTVRWRALFRLFFSRGLLGSVGRGSPAFEQVKEGRIAEVLLSRAARAFTEIPPAENYFLRTILAGDIPDPEKSHPYLRRDAFEILKNRLDRVTLVCADLETCLGSASRGAFTAFNLSDVFEYMDPRAVACTLQALRRAACGGARIGFWTLFVPAPSPGTGAFVPEQDDGLFRRSRTFFYSGFHVWRAAGTTRLMAAA